MARVLIANFDYEERLAGASESRHAAAVSGAIGHALLGIARAGDALLAPAGDPERLREFRAATGIVVEPVESLAAARAAGLEPEPWGWTPELAREHGDSEALIATRRRCHGKAYATELARELGVAIPDSVVVGCEDELASALAPFAGGRPRVLKRDLSVAGRGQLRGHGERLTAAERGGVRKALAVGPIVVQSWLERRRDLSVAARIEAGEVRITGFTENLVRGTTWQGNRTLPDLSEREPAVAGTLAELATLVGERLRGQGLDGPFGIDAFEARDGRLFPLVEINLRWTMGAMALGFAKRLGEPAVRLWREGPADVTLRLGRAGGLAVTRDGDKTGEARA